MNSRVVSRLDQLVQRFTSQVRVTRVRPLTRDRRPKPPSETQSILCAVVLQAAVPGGSFHQELGRNQIINSTIQYRAVNHG